MKSFKELAFEFDDHDNFMYLHLLSFDLQSIFIVSLFYNKTSQSSKAYVMYSLQRSERQ